ncbi:MAG TPA: lipocalin-like domain-containing protein [Gammaproteobacteria bacterium]|nr:lipocalin-like domain-containing protein [Gammaproteobacteria bacterium]
MLKAPLMIAVILLAPCRWSAAEFAFPEDHGPHPDHRIESWYFSGRLAAEENRQFGFHLGFFRLGVQSDAANAGRNVNSAWTLDEIYRAELGILDLETGRFQSYEHLSRAALGMAGSQTRPVRVWVYDWVAEALSSSNSQPAFRLRATWGEEVSLELELKVAKPALVPGGQPLFGSGSARNSIRGYSLTRMVASGRLELGERAHEVKGHAWLDRLWRGASFDQVMASLASGERTGFLTAGQIAINRFALLLENGWELLLFQMHRRDGGGVPIASGTLVYGDGSSRNLSGDELTFSEKGYWSSADGVRYPSAWRIIVPGDGIDLEVSASSPDQEVRETVRYWAGAVDVSGEAIGRPVTGHGHAALAGYGARSED